MAYANLRDFIVKLEKEKRLIRVSEPVSTHLEMTEIQTRLLAEDGPAVLFENVVSNDGESYNMPVLANLFGTTQAIRPIADAGNFPFCFRSLQGNEIAKIDLCHEGHEFMESVGA